MVTLREAIDGFLAGRLTVDELARAVPADAAAGPALLDQLALRLRRGELPREVFDSINARLGGDMSVPTTAGPAASASSAPHDATVVRTVQTPTAEGCRQQKTLSASETGGQIDGATSGTQAPGTVAWYGESKPVAPGMVLRGRFVLETVLGSGGMGTVFKARDLLKEEAKDRDPYVAVKVLGKEFRQHPDSFLALQREARKSQTLAHPNIVTVYDFDRDGPIVFMHMEYLDGQPLNKIIRKHRAAGGMALADCWHIVEGICRALSHAHEKGIVHADLKPGNVFVTKEGEVKVLDFGIARVFERPGGSNDTTQFDAGSLKALTLSYASCEMLDGADPDPRDDIYAVACVIFELLTGQHPFGRVKATDARDANSKPARIPGLKRWQWRAVCHALAFERDKRIPDVASLYRALSTDRTKQRRRTGLTLAGVLAVAAIGIVTGLTLTDRGIGLDELPAATFIAPHVNPEQAEMLLEQAEYYLELTAGDFDIDLLTQGVSNANDAFRTVLSIEPGNERAIAGRQEIGRRLADEARALVEAGDETAGRRLVIIGLSKVDRENRDLVRLFRRLGAPPPPAN